METMEFPRTLLSPHQDMLGNPRPDEFSRADLMTPFSLSLAAEKAIESAKLKLDQMDSRLLRARTSIAMAKSITHRVSADQLTGRKVGALSPGSAPASPVINPPDDFRDDEAPVRTIEMVKLRDDLRRLRSRMGQSRAISETLNLTPPRARRSRPTQTGLSDRSLTPPVLKPMQKSNQFLDQFPLPPATAAEDTPNRRLSVVLAGQPPELWPTIECFGKFVNRDGTSNFGVITKEPFETSDADDLPILTTKAEAPFSPRPYSSQSLLTAPASPGRESISYPSNKALPFPPTLKVSFPEDAKRPRWSTSNAGPTRRPPIAHALSRISYVTANESFSDLGFRGSVSQRHSGSSLDYSDPDTSTGGGATPGKLSPSIQEKPGPSESRKAGSVRTQASKDSLRPRSTVSDGSFASLSGVAAMSLGEQEPLLRRCQSALQRISVSGTSERDQSRRSRRLEAVLAILEDAYED